MKNKRLMILDGNSLLYRSYFALPPLVTKEGIHTNGVYGFLTMFNNLVDEYSPDYMSVVFDLKAPTFRHKEYSEYKAGRAKTPNELKMQFVILKEVLDKLGINRMEIEGYEADDLAGTLAKLGNKEGLEVILVTGDKDYLQLADENTKVFITKKGISNIEVYDREAMLEKYELTPEQFIDLKGFMGDKSDNIPGVPGVGEKTGIKLLKAYGSMEEVYENIDKVSGKKLKEKLIENKQQAFMSRRLSRIVVDVPMDFELEKLKMKNEESEELYELYKKLEFNKFLKNMDRKQLSIEATYQINKDKIEVINDKNELQRIIKEIEREKEVGFRFLIDGEKALVDSILALGIKIHNDESYYIDFEKVDLSETLDELKDIFESENIKKIGHNIKRDIIVLKRHEVHIEGVSFDNMIGQYLINPSQKSYSIKTLAYDYLSIEIQDEEAILGKGKKKKRFSDISIEDRIIYLSNQMKIIYDVKNEIEKKIKEQGMDELYYNVEIPLIEVLADMEYLGFKVDIQKLQELGEELDIKIKQLTNDIYSLANEEFNINSPKQLANILFEKLELPVIKKTKTGYSTNAEVLEKLRDKHDIIEKILEFRQLGKLKSTYVDGLIQVINKDGRVHSSFNQTITTTGRISSTEPNLQNIPIRSEEGRKIREVFVVKDKEHVLVDADYSQIELRVLAHISDDDKLKEAFFTEEDIHIKTAAEVFGVEKAEVTSAMRSKAKAVNFGIMYGISDYGLSRDLKISRKEAKIYIENYLSNYQKVEEYMHEIIKFGKEKGYVETILKRRRYISEINSKNFNVRSFGERTAMNTPIQGSAADIIKIAMLNVYQELKKRKLKSKLILQVHDELIIETPKEELKEVEILLKEQMEKAIKLSVPLKVDMKSGDSWYDTK